MTQLSTQAPIQARIQAPTRPLPQAPTQAATQAATKTATISRHRRDVLQVIDNEMRAHSSVQAQRLALLSEDLVLVSNVDGDPLGLELEELDLADELSACAAIFPELMVYADTAKGLRLRGDRMRVRQLFTNLFRNAERRGGRPLWLFAHPRHGVLNVRVPDVSQGDGYELSIVKFLVRAHGGSCAYSSTGRILSLSFPLVG